MVSSRPNWSYVALVLTLFAGEVIKPFGLVLSFGIAVGTFSSIFVAAPILLLIERRWGRRRVVTRPVASQTQLVGTRIDHYRSNMQ